LSVVGEILKSTHLESAERYSIKHLISQIIPFISKDSCRTLNQLHNNISAKHTINKVRLFVALLQLVSLQNTTHSLKEFNGCKITLNQTLDNTDIEWILYDEEEGD